MTSSWRRLLVASSSPKSDPVSLMRKLFIMVRKPERKARKQPR